MIAQSSHSWKKENNEKQPFPGIPEGTHSPGLGYKDIVPTL